MNRLVKTSISHKVYKHSILDKAAVYMEFDPFGGISQEAFDTFMNTYFHVEPKPVSEFMERGVSLRAVDGDVEFRLMPTSVMINLGGANYVSFADSMQELADMAVAFVREVCRTEYLNSLEIRKTDMLPVKSDVGGEHPDISVLLKDFFTVEMAEAAHINFDEIDGNDVSLLKEFYPSTDAEHVSLKVRYGYLKEENAEWRTSLIFDSFAKYTKRVDIGQIQSVLDLLNAQLFGLFHGCISESIIKMLD